MEYSFLCFLSLSLPRTVRDSKLPLNLHFFLSDFCLHTRFRTTSFTKTKAHHEEDENRGRKDIPTPILETSAVAPVCQCETGDMEGGGGKTKAHHKEEEDRGRKDFPTPILETSAVAPVCQRETEETEGGGGKTKTQHEGEED